MSIKLQDYINAVHWYEYPEISNNRTLYELMLLVVREKGRKIRITKYERPTKIEHLMFRYGLKGIKVTSEPDPDNKFGLIYHLEINRDTFLTNLEIFHHVDCVSLKNQYDKIERRKRTELARKEKTAKKNGGPSPFERFILCRGLINGHYISKAN